MPIWWSLFTARKNSEFQAFEDGSSTKGIAEIILAKNRNGPVDDVRLRFREEKAQFVDIDDFDLESSPDMSPGVQSVTFGSKMNHDNFRKLGGEFDHESGIHEEPPFALVSIKFQDEFTSDAFIAKVFKTDINPKFSQKENFTYTVT